MSGSEFVWGAVLVVCGIFIAVYGSVLFRFVLAALGFAVGFAVVYLLTDGQSAGVRFLVAAVAGAIIGFLLYRLVQIGIYVAGGVAGIVVALILAALFGWLGNSVDWKSGILLIAGAGLGGFFGRRLGDWIIILATAGAGALFVVNGVLIWFSDRYATDETGDPTSNLDKPVVVVTFFVIFAIAALAQLNSTKLRDRLYRFAR